jgi:pimeloyl-ACP methyl ester carboxylesterase
VAIAIANGIQLEYDTAGDVGAPAMLLIQGLSGQLTAWDDDFVNSLAGHGFFVVRFDNRDVGLSTKLEGGEEPDILGILGGDRSSAPYLLADMADDTVGLLDALGIDQAHIVGISLGGMVAQCLAISHPERCLSLISVMSTTGAEGVGMVHPDALEVLLMPTPEDRDAIIERNVENAAVGASPGIAFDDHYHRARSAAAFDRCWYPAGATRQTAAMLASPDRTGDLAKVTVPTLVVHGAGDRIVDVSGGRATAEAIPGAELYVISGLGHEIPPPFRPIVIEAIVTHAGRNTIRRFS